VPVGLLDADADVAGELEAELDELLLLLLHPAASAVQAMASSATRGALFLVRRGIIPRTLPLLVARRKQRRHHGPGRLWFPGPIGASRCVKSSWQCHRQRGIVDR